MKAVLFLVAAVSILGPSSARYFSRTDDKLRALDLALKPASGRKDSTDANALVDEILDIVNLEIQALGYDPYYAEFDVLELFNLHGNLSGLSSLARTSDAQMDEDGLTLIITTDVGLFNLTGDLAIESDWYPDLEASAGVKIADIDVDLKIQATLPLGPFELDTFKTVDIGNVEVTITGLGPFFDSILDDLSSAIANAVKGLVADLLDGVIKDILNAVLKNL